MAAWFVQHGSLHSKCFYFSSVLQHFSSLVSSNLDNGVLRVMGNAPFME